MIVPVLGLADDDYLPLSKQEAEDWLFTVTMDELIDFVIKYDYVEHVDPLVHQPTIAVVLDKKNDLYLSYPYAMNIEIGHLEYDVMLQEHIIEDFVPKKGNLGEKILIVTLIFMGGAFTGALIAR